MDPYWKNILWSQFGAAIDMLENTIRACPDDLWGDRSQHIQFWYTVYHTLFWLDLYLSGIAEDFSPPPPFTLIELDPSGQLPERVYTQAEILGYLEHGRAKCRETIQALTDERVLKLCGFDDWHEKLSFGELLLYTMRHVQEHTGQLNLLLGQTHNRLPDWGAWVGRAKDRL
jgi:hypothetical protein